MAASVIAGHHGNPLSLMLYELCGQLPACHERSDDPDTISAPLGGRPRPPALTLLQVLQVGVRNTPIFTTWEEPPLRKAWPSPLGTAVGGPELSGGEE